MDLPSHIIEEGAFSFWKNLLMVFIFFTITPIVIGTSLFALVLLNDSPKAESDSASMQLNVYSKSGVRIFASLPTSVPSIGDKIESADARAELIRQYLADFNSPLEPYAYLIVAAADKYKLDFRLTTAIAQKESNLCKVIPPGSFNCWGWGIHSQGTLGFDSFEEGIEVVSRGLREEYLNKGYLTIEEIMSKYTPLSKGSWASGVTKFMNDIQ